MASNSSNDANQTVSVGNWLLTFFLFTIPVVNIIVFIVWLASDSTPPSKKNFLIAWIVWFLIGMVLMIVFWGSIAALAATLGAGYF